MDVKNKTLKLEKGGDDITYDKLIIATGSTVSTHCLFESVATSVYTKNGRKVQVPSTSISGQMCPS